MACIQPTAYNGSIIINSLKTFGSFLMCYIVSIKGAKVINSMLNMRVELN